MADNYTVLLSPTTIVSTGTPAKVSDLYSGQPLGITITASGSSVSGNVAILAANDGVNYSTLYTASLSTAGVYAYELTKRWPNILAIATSVTSGAFGATMS